MTATLTGIIERKTCLIPYIIAERATWGYCDKYHPDWTPQECDTFVAAQIDWLVEKADTVYFNSPIFRKQITSSDKGRCRLESFFFHWLQSRHKPKGRL